MPQPCALLIDLREITDARLSDMDRYDVGVLASRDSIGAAIALVASEGFVDPAVSGNLWRAIGA